MSVQTSVFGSVRLSGKEAKAFERQIKHGRSKKAARESLARGSVILGEFAERGVVKVKLSPEGRRKSK